MIEAPCRPCFVCASNEGNTSSVGIPEESDFVMKYPRCFRQERDLNLQDAVRYERGQKTGRWDRLRFLKQFLESFRISSWDRKPKSRPSFIASKSSRRRAGEHTNVWAFPCHKVGEGDSYYVEQ